MRLIKIETKGFKSFANKVSLVFDGGIVGIVGPNGSGKSNINDAIKWVLGERSIKSLRGTTSEDIIFAGSKAFPASDVAEVSLTFDNSDHAVSLPHKTFVITRRIERGSGSSEYYINNEVAKLKEIEEIAMESGISKSSLAIISQGTVQNIAQASPLERRLIFEEAAGISKYKAKKEEALRKLDKTSESLEQLKAIIYELERQLNPLKKQADKARLFLSKKDELKGVEIGLIVQDLAFFGTKIQELKIIFEEFNLTKADLSHKLQVTEEEIIAKGQNKVRLETEVVDLANQMEDISEKLKRIEIASTQLSQRRQMIIEGQIVVSDSARLQAMREELEQLNLKNNQYQDWRKKLNQDIDEKNQQIGEKQQTLNKIQGQLEFDKRDVMQLKTKIAILKDQAENRTHLFKGTKVILDNAMLFPGLVGLVADIVKVESIYVSAIETVLGSSLQFLVVDHSDTAIKAINFLKANHAGRSSFIPLNTIRPKGIIPEHYDILKMQEGFVGIASDLVHVEPRYDLLRKFLLGNILVASQIEQAEKISRLMKSQYLVVTLEGDTIRTGGVISGGERKDNRDFIGLKEQIVELEAKLPEFEKALVVKQIEWNRLQNLIAEEQMIVNSLNLERSKVIEKQETAESQFLNLRSKYESESPSRLALATNVVEDEKILEEDKAKFQTLLKAKRDLIALLSHEINEQNVVKLELEKSMRDLIEKSAKQMNDYNKAEYIIKTSSERLATEYEMTIENASQNYKLTLPEDEAREFVSRIRQEIKDLGHVNLDAIGDFDAINERYQKLKTHEVELNEAKQIIVSAINEMDEIIINKLNETVNNVNQEISLIFQKMFGGGHAEVRYTNPDNLLETGIEVVAQPPGKTIKNLNLFSGGEKSMVAISLLFAILKSKPLPLCILDEVEAALDEANVIRFAEYLQELRAQTQFLVITHRVGTMSLVDSLVGATMQTKGVTSFFTVKLAEAKKLIEV